MRNLLNNPTQNYTEYSAVSPMLKGGMLRSGAYKGLLNLETGKFYIRISDIGAEPQNVPQTWVLATYTITIETHLEQPNGATTHVHDDTGNSYVLYSEIM